MLIETMMVKLGGIVDMSKDRKVVSTVMLPLSIGSIQEFNMYSTLPIPQ